MEASFVFMPICLFSKKENEIYISDKYNHVYNLINLGYDLEKKLSFIPINNMNKNIKFTFNEYIELYKFLNSFAKSYYLKIKYTNTYMPYFLIIHEIKNDINCIRYPRYFKNCNLLSCFLIDEHKIELCDILINKFKNEKCNLIHYIILLKSEFQSEKT